MQVCNKSNYLSDLKGISLVGSSLITGISIYIQKVDHPSLLTLPTEFGLSKFRETYKRILVLQLGLAISTSIASFLTFLSIYNSKCNLSKSTISTIQDSINHCCKCNRGYLWLLGSLLVFSTLPYTYFFVAPINKKLLSKDLDSYSSHANSLLVKWGKLHKPRTIILIASTGCFFYKIFNHSHK